MVEGHQAYCHDSLERNFRPCRRLATRTRLPRKGSLPNSRLGPDQASAPKILQLGGTEVGVALMSWRARTPNFIMAMTPGVDCSLRAHPSSLPTAE